MSILLIEIVDKNLIYSVDIVNAIKLKKEHVISKLYDPNIHTLDWSSKNGLFIIKT
jgi:hypothetical protein